MTQPGYVVPCPRCGAPMPAGAAMCKSCAGGSPPAAPGSPPASPLSLARLYSQPTPQQTAARARRQVRVLAGMALACGLAGAIVPILAAITGLIGIVCGIVTLVTHARRREHGSLDADIMAVLAIVLCLLGGARWVLMLIEGNGPFRDPFRE
ncbi:MAG: hypothetical protein HYS13_21830 [Planctomycetia bacterium]|nr:hypothetical protein [Planctomycetia bacterium]